MIRLWLAALALVASPALGAAEISGARYREAVAALEVALGKADLPAVTHGAAALGGTTVVIDGAAITPDPSLFGPLAAAGTLTEARAFAPRLGALRRALDARLATPERVLDRELLAALAAASGDAERPSGEGLEIAAEDGWLQAVGDLLRPVRDFLVKLWREFWEWLKELFQPDSAEGGWLAGLDLPSLVVVAVVALALAFAVLALRSWRARRRPAQASAPTVVAPAVADDDPLSRDEGGWRRYAAELARSGRTREAIRAWYHAVLVALYGQGLVSYRKGRTNWELVAALSPAHGFRAALIEFTRLFDREWYGLRQSSPEALAEAEDLAAGLLAAIAPGGRPS